MHVVNDFQASGCDHCKHRAFAAQIANVAPLKAAP
jgi:hypothetical protein